MGKEAVGMEVAVAYIYTPSSLHGHIESTCAYRAPLE